MRLFISLISILPVLALAAPASAGEEWICDKANSNAEHLQCADREYRKHDAELNAVYKALLKESEGQNDPLPGAGPPPLQALKEAQRAWVSYRDANCRWKASSFYGGSGQPVIMMSCLAITTRDRVKELRSFMQD